MKKFRVVAAIAVCVMLAVVFSSCRSEFPETPSKFVVVLIKPNKTKGTNLYFVEPIETKSLNMSSTWFVDSIGKFNICDTLSFQHYR